jgi:hypothetical protein
MTTHFVSPKGFKVTARTAEYLSDAASTTTVAQHNSKLYKVTPSSGDKFQELSVAGTTNTVQPVMLMVPRSGKIADATQSGTYLGQVTNNTDPFYLIVVDVKNMDATWGFSLNRHELAVASTATMSGTNTDINAAQTVTSGTLITNGALGSDPTASNWYSIPGASGKVLHILTAPGNATADVVLTAYDNISMASTFAVSDDLNYHEDLVTTATSTGKTYYVSVTWSKAGQGADTTQNKYQVLFLLE